MIRDNIEDYLKNFRAGNTNSSGIQENYAAQMSDGIEGRLTSKVS